MKNGLNVAVGQRVLCLGVAFLQLLLLGLGLHV